MMSQQAAARSGLYRLLALAFDYPHAELLDALQSGEYQEALTNCAHIVGIKVAELPEFERGLEQLEPTYLQLFEHGENGSKPCVLREGAHVDFELEGEYSENGTDKPSLMEDLLRFYHHFGLRLTADPAQKLPPDHLVCQFEILSHLSALESKKEGADATALGYRDAQRDFLRRHVTNWLPKVHEELSASLRAEDAFSGFYAAMTTLALAGVSEHLNSVS